MMLELRGSLVKRLYCVPFIVDVADFPTRGRLRTSGACNRSQPMAPWEQDAHGQRVPAIAAKIALKLASEM